MHFHIGIILRSLLGLTYFSISLKVSSGIFMNWEILYFIFRVIFCVGLSKRNGSNKAFNFRNKISMKSANMTLNPPFDVSN